MGLNPIGASDFFLDFICNCLSYNVLHNCEDHFHLYSLSTVHSILSYTHLQYLLDSIQCCWIWNELQEKRIRKTRVTAIQVLKQQPKVWHTDMSEPVNSFTMKVLQPLWNESSLRTNNCLAYSNYSYSRIGPKERTLRVHSFGTIPEWECTEWE